MAAKQKCMIIGAAPVSSAAVFAEFKPEEFFVICADAGYVTAKNCGIIPDLVVGDFDSAARPPFTEKVITLPVEKDVTDTMYAVIKGFDLGYRNFVLLGCLGGERLDHTYANIETLFFLATHDASALIADGKTKIFILRDKRLALTDMLGATVSVFPFSMPSCNVSYKGLKYPLTKTSLFCGGLLMGVSNEVVSKNAEIVIHSGTALVVLIEK